MKLTCKAMVNAVPFGKDACGQPAVMVILSEASNIWPDDDKGDALHAYPVCDDHAPEEAHEARASMDPDEFIIVPLPEPRPEVVRGPNIPGLATEERRDVRLSLMDLGYSRISPTFLNSGSREEWRDRGDGQYAEAWEHVSVRGNGITLTWGAKATDENGDPL